MGRYYIIPDKNNMHESVKLAETYNLGFEFDDFWAPNVLSDEDKVEELVRFYKGFELPDGISVHGDFFDVCIFSTDKEIADISKKRIWQSMEAADKMGAEKVIFHSNINSFLAQGAYLDNWINQNEVFFRQVCAQYPAVTVLMENMFDDNPDALAALAHRMEDVTNFDLCFDYAHAMISSAPIEEWVGKTAPYIRHVHINDNDGQSDLHLAVGSGVTDWGQFGLLQKQYFNEATVLIEVSQLTAQKESLEYLKKNGLL